MSICVSVMAVKRPNISYCVAGLTRSLNVSCFLSLRFSFLWLYVPVEELVAMELHILGDVSCFIVNILPSKAMFAFLAPSDKTYLEDLQPFSFILARCRNVYLATAC